MTSSDFKFVLQRHFGDSLTPEVIGAMVEVNDKIYKSGVKEGGPFEFNLRDLLRWAGAVKEVSFCLLNVSALH
jgi:midasin (ATPase involved in ribosome maturation)